MKRRDAGEPYLFQCVTRCHMHLAVLKGQVSAWQSATLLPISCKTVQTVPILGEGCVL